MAREKTKVPTEQKAEMKDKEDVICPLVLLVTRKEFGQMNAGAVNYDIAFQPTIQLGDADVGAWRSAPQLQLTEEGKKVRETEGYKALGEEHIVLKGKSPQARKHSLAFYRLLEEGKKKGTFSWEEDCYYFTHEEGIEARKQYEKGVLDGEIKGNKRSWEGRFAELTGVSWEQLQEKHPDIYGTAKKTETETSEPEMSGEDETTPEGDPTPEAIAEANAEIDEEIEHSGEGLDKDDDLAQESEEETAVAASSATEETVKDETSTELEEPWSKFDTQSNSEIINALDKIEDPGFLEDIIAYEKSHKDRGIIVHEAEMLLKQKLDDNSSKDELDYENATRFVAEPSEPQRVDLDRIIWRDSGGHDQIAYLVEVEDLAEEYWLPEGTHVIEGHTIIIECKKD